MNAWLRPIEGATKTALFWDGQTLTATDEAADTAIRVKPAALHRYSYVQEHTDTPNETIGGLAALDEDGLVLLDLPGPWDHLPTKAFAAAAGLHLTNVHHDAPAKARVLLAARAPGWRRLHGRRPSFLSRRRWRGLVAICAGVVGLVVMAYLAVNGAWMVWRGLSFVGRIVLDLVDARLLMIAFSPALLVLRPVMARLQRRRSRTGALLAQVGGPYLTVKSGKLRIERGKEAIIKFRIGPRRSEASTLLLYHYTPTPLRPPAHPTPTESTARPATSDGRSASGSAVGPPAVSDRGSAAASVSAVGPPAISDRGSAAASVSAVGPPAISDRGRAAASAAAEPAMSDRGSAPAPASTGAQPIASGPRPAPKPAETAAQPVTPNFGTPPSAEPGSVLSPAAVGDGSGPPAAVGDGSGPPAAAVSAPSAVGLFVLSATGQPLLHLPGPWDAGMAQRFAERQHLRLAVHRVSREEYLNLARTCRDAIP
ncbi:hypothetical protein [Nonomuraea cavernae]|uniref:hypothetical protein n=1 Tax=Nonomuraea cavernae TaxID=2045107 RepID=UPI0016670D55|nr:hypothetical protein [Nonomuraea cavernae]MCA2186064.1 hypothetical protein [Nonomuraea cavernae]